MKPYCGHGGTAPSILDYDTGWTYAASIMSSYLTHEKWVCWCWTLQTVTNAGGIHRILSQNWVIVTHKLVSIPFSLLLSRFGKTAHFSHSFCISISHGTDMFNLYGTLNRCMHQHIWHDRQNGICDIHNSVTQVQKIHCNIVHTSYIQCKDNIKIDVTELGLEGIEKK